MAASDPDLPPPGELSLPGELSEVIARIDWRTSDSDQPSLLALIDGSGAPGVLLRHVGGLAEALGMPVTAGAMIEDHGWRQGAVDPIAWAAKRNDRRASVCSALDDAGMPECRVIVFSGKDRRHLLDWVEPRRDMLVALSAGLADPARAAPAQDHLHALVRQGAVSLFVVRDPSAVEPPYRRILIPLSGAIGSEAVLPTVERIAAKMNASVTLAYLRSKQHSLFPEERSEAESYLSGIVSRMGEWIERVETRYLPLEDAGRALVDLIARESVDLVVTLEQGSAEGKPRPPSEPTRYLLDQCPVPLLLLRHEFHLTALPWIDQD